MMMSMAELAEELHVDRRQVWAWQRRRARNGFPAPVKTIARRGRTVPVWDLNEVRRWRETYVPSKGGRPRSKTVEETC